MYISQAQLGKYYEHCEGSVLKHNYESEFYHPLCYLDWTSAIGYSPHCVHEHPNEPIGTQMRRLESSIPYSVMNEWL